MNVIRGIKFKIPNAYGKYLEVILKQISSSEYIWIIEEDEIYINENSRNKQDNNNENLFKKTIYENSEFQQIIKQENYYMIFANIKLYIKPDNITIKTYNDFVKSSCILILLVTDNEFVEIYSKDENILKVIYDNALKNSFYDIKYITEENFKREKFSAYTD